MPQKAQQGSPWKPPEATQQNAWDDAAADYQHRRELSRGHNFQRESVRTSIVKAKNSTGGNRVRGDIVEFQGGLLATTDADHIWLDGGLPTHWQTASFGVLRQPTPQNVIADCQVSGVCEARVYWLNSSHQYARKENGLPYLVSCHVGPVKILNAPTGSGVELCVVEIDQFETDTNKIKCKNVSQNTRSQWDLVGIANPTWGFYPQSEPGGDMAEPTWTWREDDERWNRHGVLQHIVAAGEYGRVQVTGVTPATVYIHDVEHLYCGSYPGEYRLVSCVRGPHRILNAPTSTGQQTCLVALGNYHPYVGFSLGYLDSSTSPLTANAGASTPWPYWDWEAVSVQFALVDYILGWDYASGEFTCEEYGVWDIKYWGVFQVSGVEANESFNFTWTPQISYAAAAYVDQAPYVRWSQPGAGNAGNYILSLCGYLSQWELSAGDKIRWKGELSVSGGSGSPLPTVDFLSGTGGAEFRAAQIWPAEP